MKIFRNSVCFFVGVTSAILLLAACSKKSAIGPDPYAGGKAPLGISFGTASPSPASGPAGSVVTYQVKGLNKYASSFIFQVSNEPTQILNVTDSTVTVQIPGDISSGIATVIVNGQVFFGPRFTVTGNVSIDPGFLVGTGTDGPVNAVYDFGQGYMLVGSFTNYNKYYVTNTAFINYQGAVATNFNIGTSAANGPLTSVSGLSNGKFIIAGNFNSFHNTGNIGNITRLNSNATLDVSTVSVINQTPALPAGGLDTVPSYNGAVQGDQNIVKTFITSTGNVIAVGNISSYTTISYPQSTRLGFYYIYKKIFSVMRTDQNGVLDTTYNYGTSRTGANAIVNDAYLEPDDKLVMVGNFTSFNGKAANYIVRLDVNGNSDPTYNSGSGANGKINTVQYNATTHRAMITGNFTTYNGIACPGIAMLNDDGSVDPTFVFRQFSGGQVTFARMLNTSKVLVAGTFDTYDNVSRPGFLLLNADGSAVQTFNHVGTFQGQIQQVIETTATDGNYAIILFGLIQKFDDTPVNNIVKVEIKN
jgi:hypothetical protein